MAVTFDYTFAAASASQASALQLHNPLLALLDAIRLQGSIGKAAKELGLSYRHVWGELKRHEALFGQSLIAGGQGQAAQLSSFGERLLWAEKRILARLLPQAESLASQLDRELLVAADPDLQVLPACASHDALFGTLRAALHREARVLLDIEYADHAHPLERLNAGTCLLAGIHLPLDDENLCRRGSRIHRALGRKLRLGVHKPIRFAEREQGLIVASGNPLGIASLKDLTRPGIVFMNRPRASGTRLLLDELLARERISPRAITGYATEELTHLSVAASVTAGHAHCGFGLRAAAKHFALDFVPIAREQYFLVCMKDALETPPMAALIGTLRSADFRRLVAAQSGYDAAKSGEIVSLRRTLPWYK
jgi:putative molybdopterin biosynthesis protein